MLKLLLLLPSNGGHLTPPQKKKKMTSLLNEIIECETLKSHRGFITLKTYVHNVHREKGRSKLDLTL